MVSYVKDHRRGFVTFLLLSFFIIASCIALFFIDTEEIVRMLGINNVYALALIVAFISSFTGASFVYITVLIALVSGGVHPVYIAIPAGIGLMLGDMLLYYTVRKGRDLVNEDWEYKIESLANRIRNRKHFTIVFPIVAYFYSGFSPFPNNLLIVLLAAMRYSPVKAIIILLAGDTTFALLVTLFASAGTEAF